MNSISKSPKTTRLAPVCAVAAALALATAPAARAATFSWDGGDADDDNWTSADNWTSSAPPDDGTADIRFNADAGNLRTSPSADTNDPWNVNSITFITTGSANFTIGGNALDIDGVPTSGSLSINVQEGTQTINNNIHFSRATTQIIGSQNGTTLALGGTITSLTDDLTFDASSGNDNGTLSILASGVLNLATFNVLSNTTSTGSNDTKLTLNATTNLADRLMLMLTDSTAETTADVAVTLSFTGTDTIAGLTINGVVAATGTWGAIGSGADHEDSHFTGAGLLYVVPEPSTFAMLLGGLGMLLSFQRCRRALHL
jgi:hypothetical protein